MQKLSVTGENIKLQCYHNLPTRIARFLKTDSTECREDVEQQRPLTLLKGVYTLVQSLLEQFDIIS